MSFLKDVSITGGIADFFNFVRRPGQFRVLPAILALLFPCIIIGGFLWDAERRNNVHVPQEVIYVESWSLDRSDEEILKDRWEIQCQKEALQKEQRERYKALANASGFDADEIERKILEERKAEGKEEIDHGKC